MNDLYNIDADRLSTAELKGMLAQSMQVTVRHLQHLALIWMELERRGEDLSAMRSGIMEYLPMIASHKIDARIVVNYAGQKTLLAALSRLPIDKQTEVVETGYVTLTVMDSDGARQDVQVPLSSLTARQVYQVFADDHIRLPAQQYKLLAAQGMAHTTQRATTLRKARRVKVENGVLMVSNSAADLDRVLTALSTHYGVDIAELLAAAGNHIK